MNFAWIFDVAAGCLLAFFLVRGALRGFMGEVFALLGLVASLFCGWTFARPAAEIALGVFPTWDPTLTELLCSIAIFIAVSLLFALAGRLMSLLVRAANLSFADHVLGALLGALKAFCVVLFIYGVFSIFPTVVPGAWMKESFAMKGAAVVWPPVLHFLEGRKWVNLDHLKVTEGETITLKRTPLSEDVKPEPLAEPIEAEPLSAEPRPK